MTLRNLRNAGDQTQIRMAEALGIGQDSVSRPEKRSDLLLSTLRGYIIATGGSLDLVARHPVRAGGFRLGRMAPIMEPPSSQGG